MSKELIENIIDKNFVRAEEHFNDRLNSIMEQKLYEVKRSMQLDELQGYRATGAKSGPLVGKTDAEKREFWKTKIDQRKAERAYAATRTAEKEPKLGAVRASVKYPEGSEQPKKRVVNRRVVTPAQKFRNALMGRDIDHKEPKMSDTQRRNKRPGLAGLAGKAIRGGLKGLESGLNSLEE
jgi:hypothetical protein